MDRVLALHARSRGFDSHGGHMSERFFRSSRPGYPHPVSSELENSGIKVVVGDCSVTERRRWRPPYQTGKTVHVHAKYYKHNEHGRTAPGVCGNGSVPLSQLGNVVTRIGIHTHTLSIGIFHSWEDTLLYGIYGLKLCQSLIHALLTINDCQSTIPRGRNYVMITYVSKENNFGPDDKKCISGV